MHNPRRLTPLSIGRAVYLYMYFIMCVHSYTTCVRDRREWDLQSSDTDVNMCFK